jgi:hypothetical protein
MKKFALLLAAVLMAAIGADVFAQGSQQTVTINSTRNYWVNSTDGTTQDVSGHDVSTYQWAVYTWDGSADYTSDSWTANAATAASDYNFTSGSTSFNTQIEWLATGTFVVEVVETSDDNCTTVRRFGVTVIDLDLLVVTKDHTGTTLSAAGTYCNTNSGDIWGDSNDDNLNNESLATMTMTYEISLYTVKGSTDSDDLIGTALPAAAWKFTAVDASTIPTSGSVTWSVTDAATGASYSTGDNNEILVPAGTSTVTITAEIQNIAAEDVNDYVLGFSIDPSTVLVENGGTAGDYEEGQEPAAYTGADGSHTNSAYTITVNPIPNTTKIKFD